MSSDKPRVLIAEDDPGIRDLLELGFRYEGYEVSSAGGGSEALGLFSSAPPHLVILDLGLPGLDGGAVLRAIRARSGTPVLILTARDGVEERIAHLRGGADDDLVKPFVFGELAARVQAVLRRTQPQFGREQRYADLCLDTQLREATRGGGGWTSARGRSTCSPSSCAIPSGCCPRPCCSTACGARTSWGTTTSWRCTSGSFAGPWASPS